MVAERVLQQHSTNQGCAILEQIMGQAHCGVEIVREKDMVIVHVWLHKGHG